MNADPFDTSTDRSTKGPACPVVFVQTGAGDTDRHAFGGGLPDEAFQEIGAATAGWRDRKYMARYLEGTVKKHRLPGLAVVMYPRKEDQPVIPPGFTVPFEPMQINEDDAQLRTLFESLELPIGPKPARTYAKRTPFLMRLAPRFGMPSAAFWALFLNACLQAAILGRVYGLGRHGFWLGPAVVIFLTAAFVFVFRSVGRRWFLIPGGVVIRRGVFRQFAVSLVRLTASDSILLISRHEKISGWHVQIWRESRSWWRIMTDLEMSALLAAWQSAVPAPTLAQLDDLR